MFVNCLNEIGGSHCLLTNRIGARGGVASTSSGSVTSRFLSFFRKSSSQTCLNMFFQMSAFSVCLVTHRTE